MENLTVEEALEQLLSHTEVIQETETVSLLKSKGRILAEDIKSELDNPPFDRSPIDGYACKAEDLAGASPSTPVCLKVTREIDAGDYSDETVKKGEAVRIMTGAAVPAGCDCCVRQEDTDYGEDTVQIYKDHQIKHVEADHHPVTFVKEHGHTQFTIYLIPYIYKEQSLYKNLYSCI